MADADRPARLSLYSIAAHRGFADALAAGLIPRYREGDAGLARLTLLLPSRRAIRTMTEAFVRASGGGMLLPRMAVVGDLDLDETLGPLLDPIGSGGDIPPAADPARRWLRLAQLLRGAMMREGLSPVPSSAALLRQARDIGRAMDRLLVEDVPPEALWSDPVLDRLDRLSEHWKRNLKLFATVQQFWLAELTERGELDAPARRNRLLDRAASKWRERPPPGPVVAAGVTSASPAIARLLRSIAGLPNGAVVLPDLDLALDEETWKALGRAGRGETAEDNPIGRADAATHPQYHLKLLLNRMGVARDEFRPWHRAGAVAAPPERSCAISNLFLPSEESARWVRLPARERRLAGVRLMETANPEEEAQAIAVLIREALEAPAKRVALITPDRGLAGRVVAHLSRWEIAADDSAGVPLPQTPAGRMILLLAELVATRCAPVPFIAAISHPLAGREQGRADWLRHARALDLALRGPRLDTGLAPLARLVKARAGERGDGAMAAWWVQVERAAAPLAALGDAEEIDFAAALDTLTGAAEALCGEAVWAQSDGRSLSSAIESLRDAARSVPTALAPEELPAVLRDAFDPVAVRPPYGGHPRVAIYGLIEARMSRADLVICGGMHEGSWPAAPAPDPLVAPPVLRALGVPGGDFRIGLSAHDLAAALGAPEAVLSHARRDATGPVIASRFVLRVRAMLGELLDRHLETRAPRLARSIDRGEPVPPHPRPGPMPSAEQRRLGLSATGLDRLRSDPYQFYAQSILRLRALDAIDEAPTPAWRGSAVHAILEAWWKQHGAAPGTLIPLAETMLDSLSGHPFMRGLWRPRLLRALAWIEAETAALQAEGRTILAAECDGAIEVDGVRIYAKADRIDRCADGTLAIVDYKTGAPPGGAMVAEGFALQLGTVGLVAAGGGFDPIEGTPDRFEYWSLGRSKEGFGYRREPVAQGNRKGLPRERFLARTDEYLRDAIAQWITGDQPFTARLNPDLPGYNDYDQLMRLDEWQAREVGEDGAGEDGP